MQLTPKQKFKTPAGVLVAKSITKRGRGYTVTYSKRGQADRSVPLQKFERLVGAGSLYVL